MRALVIGADGFAGRWLVRHLIESGDQVSAAVGPRFRPPLQGVDLLRQLDVRDADALSAFVADARPETVYDLAGVSSRGDREDVDAAVGVTVVGAMNVLLACTRIDPSPRLLFVSTGYVYRPGDAPLHEDSPLGPTSLYAAAKLAAERALLTVGESLGVEPVIARPFNHIGPGQAESFVVPTVARQVAEIVAGTRMRVEVSDPSATRDFSDVRDVVDAYRRIACDGVAGEVYNIASGRGTSIAEAARLLGQAAGVRVEVASASRARAHDGPSVLLGDAGRVKSLGWRPVRTLPDTLSDVLAAVLTPRS